MKKVIVLFFIGVFALSAILSYKSITTGMNALSFFRLSSHKDKQVKQNLIDHTSEPEKASNVVENSTTVSERLSLSFTGDVLLDRGVGRLIEQQGPDAVLGDTKDILMAADVAMINLENPVSTRGTKENDKKYTFRAKPESLETLNRCGIDIVTLANNHVLDFGEEALLDTLDYLNAASILYAGAGKDVDQASAPVFIEKKNCRFAFIASSHVIPFASWAAGKGKPGVATTYDPTRIRKEIQKARDQADIVVVYVHWGEEMKTKPLAYQRNLAKIYIDSGADIVIGSHPHVLQGFEFYNGKLIAYSLGNFIFTNSKNNTLILNIDIENKEFKNARIIPCEINNLKTALIKDAERTKMLYQTLSELSFSVKIGNDGVLEPM